MSEIYMYADGSDYKVRGKTWGIRETLKELGGRWDPRITTWTVPRHIQTLAILRKLGVRLQVKAERAAFCHEAAATVFVDSADADRGDVSYGFCSLCDSQWRQPIAVKRLPE